MAQELSDSLTLRTSRVTVALIVVGYGLLLGFFCITRPDAGDPVWLVVVSVLRAVLLAVVIAGLLQFFLAAATGPDPRRLPLHGRLWTPDRGVVVRRAGPRNLRAGPGARGSVPLDDPICRLDLHRTLQGRPSVEATLVGEHQQGCERVRLELPPYWTLSPGELLNTMNQWACRR
jgi:hypothetical protein